jgi:hypothetical protein
LSSSTAPGESYSHLAYLSIRGKTDDVLLCQCRYRTTFESQDEDEETADIVDSGGEHV